MNETKKLEIFHNPDSNVKIEMIEGLIISPIRNDNLQEPY